MVPQMKHTVRWLASCALIVAPIITCMAVSHQTHAQETNAAAKASLDAFPDEISPSHVYARLELLDRCLDKLVATRNTAMPESPLPIETQLGPHHVYQMVLACTNRVQQLDDQTGVLAVPTLSARPTIYAPRDVRFVVDLMLDSVQRIARTLEVEDLPADEHPVSGKTPTDVFALATTVFVKLNKLCGIDEISPSEVYAEMVRGTEDVRSILRQADPESRYRVDAPPSEDGLEPSDVFKKCLEIRHLLNTHRRALGKPAVPVPDAPLDQQIRPRDVFVQSQIIIADLNFLKLHTNTVSSTPLAVPVRGAKVPSDVHQQASMVEYLLRQVNTGAETVLEAKK